MGGVCELEFKILVKHRKYLKYVPSWFEVKSAVGIKKPHKVGTNILVEDEQGLRYAKRALTKSSIQRLQCILPMGVSVAMPVYLHFIKSINLKRYSVYACYSEKARVPLFYTTDISYLGKLRKK